MSFYAKRQKKRMISALLCGTMAFAAGAQAFAVDNNTEEIISSTLFTAAARTTNLAESGYALKRLGVMQGDDDGNLMLDKSCTRHEALTAFLALLGERETAKTYDYSYTYTDVAEWCSRYVGYGVYHKYTNGTSDITFSGENAVTAQQYMTFVLRALGYQDPADFWWENAMDKAVEIGLCTQTQADSWAGGTFLRQQMMEISYTALSTNLKDSSSTLADKLIARGKINAAQAEQEGIQFGSTYTAADTTAQKNSIASTSLENGSYEIHNAATGSLISIGDLGRQVDVVVANDTNAAGQQFTVSNNGDGSFKLCSTADTAYLLDANPTDGSDIILWTNNGTDCQNFVAVDEGSGYYSIRLQANPSMTLTMANGDVLLNSYTGSAEQKWSFNTNTEDTAQAMAKLSSIMTVYPSGTSLGGSYRFAGAGQCMGFGREVFSRMYGTTAKWSYDGSPKSAEDASLYTVTASSGSYSASNMRNLISQAKTGDILQMNTPKMHTMVFVSSDANGFTVYDANWSGPNQVSVRYVSYGAWSSRNSSGITLLHSTNYPTT